MHHHALQRPAHDQDHVARLVHGAEGQNLGARESGGDRHPVLRQVGDQGLRPGRPGEQDRKDDREA